MLLPVLGLAAGLALGLVFPMHIPPTYSQYVGIAILAALDSVFGGITAKIGGRYNEKVFISGFFGNAVLAAGLTMVGTKLDMDLYLAAVVAFGTRLFQNFAEIRRYLLNLLAKKDRI